MLCQLSAVASQPLGTLFIRHVLGASSKNSVHCVFFFVFLLCVGLPRSTTRWDTRGSLERSSDFKSEARRYRTTGTSPRSVPQEPARDRTTGGSSHRSVQEMCAEFWSFMTTTRLETDECPTFSFRGKTKRRSSWFSGDIIGGHARATYEARARRFSLYQHPGDRTRRLSVGRGDWRRSTVQIARPPFPRGGAHNLRHGSVGRGGGLPPSSRCVPWPQREAWPGTRRGWPVCRTYA